MPIEIPPGRAVLQGRPALEHCNPINRLHGGWNATLLDAWVSRAVHATRAAGTVAYPAAPTRR